MLLRQVFWSTRGHSTYLHSKPAGQRLVVICIGKGAVQAQPPSWITVGQPGKWLR